MLHGCKLGTSSNLKRWIQFLAFSAAQLCWNILLFCRDVNTAPLQEKELSLLVFAPVLSQQTSASVGLNQWCWDDVVWLKVLRRKEVLRRWLKLLCMACIVLCGEKRCLRLIFLFLWSRVVSPVFCTLKVWITKFYMVPRVLPNFCRRSFKI